MPNDHRRVGIDYQVSFYFNYNVFHLLVLLDLANANCAMFLGIYIGANESCSDGSIFKESGFGESLVTGSSNTRSHPRSRCYTEGAPGQVHIGTFHRGY